MPTSAETTTCGAERAFDPEADDGDLANARVGSGRVRMRLIAEFPSFYPAPWDLVVNGGSQGITGGGSEGIDR